MLATLIAPLLAIAAQTAPVETRALDLFDAQCATLDSTDALIARVKAAGWQQFQPEPGSMLARILTHHDQNATAGWKMDSWAFARGADRSLVVTVTSAGSPGIAPSVECRVFALDAAQPPSVAIVERWAGKPAQKRMAQAGIQAWIWEPGLRPTHETTSVIHVEASSPVREKLPLIGLIVSAQR